MLFRSSGTYQLITGSFKSQQNAMKQVSTLVEEGFTPEIIVAPNGFFRVSVMDCPDITTAEKKRDSLSVKFPESWILKKK